MDRTSTRETPASAPSDKATIKLPFDADAQNGRTARSWWHATLHSGKQHQASEGYVCLLLQDLYKSCARGGGVKRGDVCYGMLRAAACVDESDHHALMYVRHGQTVREHGVDERSVGRP